MGRGLIEPWHIVVLVVIVALLFGWKRLPDISRSVGRSMRIFKSEVSEMKNDGKDTASQPSPAASETVPGGVVPPQAPPQYTPPPQAQYVPPSDAQAQPAQSADQARRDNPAL